ncbi:MAG: Minf_1886 family protein [bacterium]
MILLHELLANDSRYPLDAYLLVNDGLQYAHKVTGRKSPIAAQELLDAIRELMIQRYGLMAKAVLSSWGINSTDDIGQVVLNLVNAGLMLQEDTESVDKFHAVYDFEQVFVENYQIPEPNSH